MNGITPPDRPYNPYNLPSAYQLPTEDCPICIEAFAGKDVRVTKPCKHMFHVTCLELWLLENTSCPLCRTSLWEREVRPAPAMPGNPGLLNQQTLGRALTSLLSAMASWAGYLCPNWLVTVLNLVGIQPVPASISNPDLPENASLDHQARDQALAALISAAANQTGYPSPEEVETLLSLRELLTAPASISNPDLPENASSDQQARDQALAVLLSVAANQTGYPSPDIIAEAISLGFLRD
ncbi:RING finger domain-containing protein [Endozoicomonas sp. ISHI1]|uniref:RING finger domain-containing protein n=1 Tax=Endozoicomonas sp. ISHI1 TaxID=2825882 RepID=UPI002147F0F2|nr:RING finger domain-containing protein [Endozoicomonas sp. ISHI1]